MQLEKEMFRIESEDSVWLPVTELGGVVEGGGLWTGVGTQRSRGVHEEGSAVAASS